MMVSLRVAALLLPLLGGCGTSQIKHIEWNSDWVDVSSDEIIPGNSTKLRSDRLATLNPQSEKSIAQWMLDQNLSIIQASDAVEKFAPLQLNGLVPAEGETVYLVRAASGAGGGSFVGYINDNGILILYGVMGSCGEQVHRVVAVSLSKRPAKVFGGCSGAL